MRLYNTTRKANKIISNFQIFDGIRCFLSFQICYAFSFFCAYYQIIQFPDDAKKFYDNFAFITLIEGVFDTAKVFFLISGFLQSFSFLCYYGIKPTLRNVLKFIAYRLLKVFPIYFFLIIYMIFFQKHFGSGPYWYLMDKYLD